MAKWSNTRVVQATYSEYRAYRGGSRWDAIQKARAAAEVERMCASLEMECAELKGERKRKFRVTLHHAKVLASLIENEKINYGDWLDIKRNYRETGMIILNLNESPKDRKRKKYEADARKTSYVYGSFDCWPPKKKRLILDRFKEISKLLEGQISESERKRLLSEKERYFESERERVKNLWG